MSRGRPGFLARDSLFEPKETRCSEVGMQQDLQWITRRITAIEAELVELEVKLGDALGSIETSPELTMGQTRRLLEHLVEVLYDRFGLAQPTRARTLAKLLAQEQFAERIPGRILVRMHALREFGNVGAHFKGEVRAVDALACLSHLVQILEWYLDEVRSHPSTVDPGDSSTRKRGETTRLDLCPYRGLDPFDEDAAEWFFGRGNDIERLLARLAAQRRLILIASASGSGKSSLVRAGVLPHVRSEDTGATTILVMRPGSMPCRALAEAIVDQLGFLDPVEKLERIQRLRAVFVETPDLMPGALEPFQADGGRVLLFVDQLEEVFTLSGSGHQDHPGDRGRGGSFESEASVFLAGLAQAVTSKRTVQVVATVRADFLGHCLEDAHLGPLVPDSQYLLGPLSRDSLRDAVVRPAERVGLQFQDGLVEQLVADAADQPGNLPLLQFALKELWRLRDQAKGELTWRAYQEELNGLHGAITRYADGRLNELTEPQREVAREVFSRLVGFHQGAEDISRIASRAELEATSPGIAAAVIDHFISHRLLTADGDDIQVAHEALIRGWATLRRWVGEDREAHVVREELSRFAERWEAGGRDDADLFGGGRLQRARELDGASRLRLVARERTFLRASVVKDRRRRLTTWGLVAASFGLLAWGTYLINEEGEKAKAAYATALVGRARASMALEQYDLAAAYAASALVQGAARAEALALALHPTTNIPERVFRGHYEPVQSLSLSPDGRYLATGGIDKIVLIWDVESGELLARLDVDWSVYSLAWSPDGAHLAVGTKKGTIRLWTDPVDSLETVPLREPDGTAIEALAWSEDSSRVAGGGSAGRVEVFTIAGEQEHDIELGARVDSLLFDRLGGVLAAGVGDTSLAFIELETRMVQERQRPGTGTLHTLSHGNPGSEGPRLVLGSSKGPQVWSVSDQERLPLAPLQSSWDDVLAASIPGTERVVSASRRDGTLRIWSASGGILRGGVVLARLPDAVMSLDVSRDGALVVAGTNDNNAYLFELGQADLPMSLDARTGQIFSLAFSMDERRLYSGSSATGHGLLSWRLDGPSPGLETEIGSRGSERRVDVFDAIVLDAGQCQLMTGSRDGRVRRWSLCDSSGKALGPVELAHLDPELLGIHDGWVRSLDVAPAGDFVVSGGRDRIVHAWSVSGGAEVPSWIANHPHGGTPNDLALSPSSGRWLVTGSSDDFLVRLWDLHNPGAPRRLEGPSAPTKTSSLRGRTTSPFDCGSGSPPRWLDLEFFAATKARCGAWTSPRRRSVAGCWHLVPTMERSDCGTPELVCYGRSSTGTTSACRA